MEGSRVHGPPGPRLPMLSAPLQLADTLLADCRIRRWLEVGVWVLVKEGGVKLMAQTKSHMVQILKLTLVSMEEFDLDE